MLFNFGRYMSRSRRDEGEWHGEARNAAGDFVTFRAGLSTGVFPEFVCSVIDYLDWQDEDEAVERG
jgi:hypothetical protein